MDWRIYERDVDIILGEEFYCNPDFARWVLGQTRSFADERGTVVEVHVSLSDEAGESDLVVVFELENTQRFALLIEDKIDAVFQAEQLERYRTRGDRGVNQGRWSKFEVLLCAPIAYIQKSPTAALFDARIAYEDIAEFLKANLSGRRGAYRAKFLESAAPKGATAYVKIKDEATDRYWNFAYQLARKEFGELEMKKPDFARNSTWIVFRPQDFPSRVHIDLKGNKGVVDLTFSGVQFSRLEPAVAHLLQDGMSVHQAGRSAVIRLHINLLHVPDLGPESENVLREAFGACSRLISFFRVYRATLESVFASAL